MAREDAVAMLERAALQGHARAQYAMSLCAANGVGVVRNQALAYAWLSLAAAQGLNKASYKMSVMEEHLTPRILAQGRRELSVLKEQIQPRR
jgi:TPR repeat protein